MASASARISAIRLLRISGGGTEYSCWRPCWSTHMRFNVAASPTRYQMKL